ncbi:MAG TPA: CDP-glucose 4,6-dehydratase [Candidatus Sulfotelmatobacter sp.]|jgi:CDP-glucose 4,6-dehydratase|nr:CDP-glucose 4,6-dehydratase [Candidatus Sulfotelmatobacter sp.]
MVDLSIFKGRGVLVTGSTGFKGSWLCSWLLELGAKVTGFALPAASDSPLFEQLRLPERINQIYGDIRDLDAMLGAFKAAQPEVVIHLAAQALVFKSYAEPKVTFDTNVGGATNLLEAVRLCGNLASLVFITSDKCYRNKEWAWGYRENDELGGADPYSASKAAAELVFTAYAESFLSARPDLIAASARAGNVIGGGDMSENRIVPDCIRALRGGTSIILRRPNSTRPWQHVLEPLSGYLALAARQLAGDRTIGGAWNFGPNAENVFTVEALAHGIVTRWGNGEVIVDPASSGLHEAQLLMLNNDKAKSALGWRPRWSFEQVVAETVDWYAQVGVGADPVAVTEAQIAKYMGA